MIQKSKTHREIRATHKQNHVSNFKLNEAKMKFSRLKYLLNETIAALSREKCIFLRKKAQRRIRKVAELSTHGWANVVAGKRNNGAAN